MKKLLSVSKTQPTLFIFFCLFFLNTNFGQTKTYTGPSNGNWNTNANWSPIGVPTAANDIVIPSGKTVAISANSFAKSVSISGTLNINDGLQLTVYNDITINSGGSFIMPGGSSLATLVVYGNYINNGSTDFWKSNVVIAGNLLSPSTSTLQKQGNVVVGGNIIGDFDTTGGNGTGQIFAVNPNATVTITPTSIDNNVIAGTQVPSTETQTLIDLVNSVIYGSSCSFLSSTNNISACSGLNALFSVTSNASSPTYQWQVNKNDGSGWNNLTNDAIYSGVTLINLTITNVSIAMNKYKYRARVTSGSCTNFANYGVLSVTTTANSVVGTVTGGSTICSGSSSAVLTLSGSAGTIIRWESSVSPFSTWTTIANTSATYTSGTLTQTTQFRAIVQNGTCSTATSTATTVTVAAANTAGVVSSTPTLCINTALTAITRTTTGATGIGTATGLPSGVTAAWATNTITISGTPTASGTFNYSIPLTGGCGSVNATGTITVNAANTAGIASSTPTVCVNTALTAITRTTTGATGIGTATGLPSGVTAAWATNTITISGTPTATGTFNYSILLTGGCGSVNATGTITVNAANTAGIASSTPTVCVNSALTAITRTTTGATGIGTATGLPSGVTAAWATNTITISGTPTASGTFNYSIPLIGGCGNVNATGSITVTAVNTIGVASSTPTVCNNTPLTAITHSTTGATGIGTATNLPTGVSATWSSNVITISGTPVASGTFNYIIPLTGGCASVNATGTITVTPNKTASAASSTPTLCVNTLLTPITHTTTGGIGIPTGLPAGVTAAWSSNIITISGTPTASGTFNYSIPLTGGCGSVNATGSITVTAANTVGVASSTPTLCINTALTAITRTTTGATGIGTATGLPAGVTAAWSSNIIRISGTPTASGTFNYSIPLTGGCGNVNATGSIVVNPNLPASVSIVSSDADNTIITGTSVTFTATPTNGGLMPSYQWQLNGTNVGTNSSSYTTTTLTTGQIVKVIMISNATPCSTSSPATSNTIMTTVIDAPSVAGTVSSNQTICPGTLSSDITLTGNTGAVQWQSSTNNSTFTNISSATSATLNAITIGVLTNTTYFRAIVTNGNSAPATSGTVIVSMGSSTTWNGTSWSNGAPTSTSTAIISEKYSHTANINACTLTVNNNSVVIVPSGYNITLNGALTVADGSSFTLENNANLIQSTNVSNSGNIIVKRNTPPLMRQDYILWSSPVANQQLLAFSPNTLANRFYTYDASTDKYAQVAFPSTSNFGPGIGYLIRVPNTHPETPTIWGGQFTGVPNNGTINLTVANAKYYAIGNPYPSTINANTFIAQNGITEALYFWRKSNNSNNSSYATYTTAGGVCNSGGDPLSLTPNGIIAVGQGFIVKTTNTNISFTNAMRVSNSNAPFLRTFDERNRIWLNLSSVSGAFYQTMVSYMPNATSGVDAAIDGRFLNDTQNALTSLINGQEYAIQGRALPFDGNDAVLLGFKAKIAENYTITLSNFDGLFTSNQSVFIKDNLTNTVHDLKSGPYTFASEAGTFNTRFSIVYKDVLVNKEENLSTNNFNQDSNISVVFSNNNNTIVVRNSALDTRVLSVSLISLKGQTISTWDVKNENQINIQLPVRDLAIGTYVVKVQTTKGSNSKKIIIKNTKLSLVPKQVKKELPKEKSVLADED